MSDHINTREMRRNPRDKAHHNKTLSAGGTTAIVEKNVLAFNNTEQTERGKFHNYTYSDAHLQSKLIVI